MNYFATDSRRGRALCRAMSACRVDTEIQKVARRRRQDIVTLIDLGSSGELPQNFQFSSFLGIILNESDSENSFI